MLNTNDEQELFWDDDRLTDFENGIYQDECEEVENVTEEMILGPGYIQYAGEPWMDTEAFQMWLGMLSLQDSPAVDWPYPNRVEITQLWLDGKDPFYFSNLDAKQGVENFNSLACG